MENKQNSIKKALKIIGPILAVIGLALTIVGFVNFFTTLGDSSFPKLFFLSFIGLPLLGIGTGITFTAFRQEISKYYVKETAPILNQAAKDIAPAIQTMTNAVKEGLTEKVVCSCGKENDFTDKYCTECGTPLVPLCPKCNAVLEKDAKFCDQCGEKL